MSHPARCAHPRLPAVDTLRGAACLAVIAQHVSVVEGPASALSHLMGAGWLGVDVFFALSGWLVTTQCLTPEFQAPGAGVAFVARRLRRLLPLTALLVLCTLLAGAASPGVALASLTGSLNWVLASAGHWEAVPIVLTPLWSLAVEVQWYASWPWCVRALAPERRRVLLGIALGLVVLAPLVRAGLLLTGASQVVVYVSTWARCDALAAGAVAAILAHTPAGAAWLLRWRGALALTATSLLGVALAVSDGPLEWAPILLVIGPITAGVLTACVLDACHTPPVRPWGSAVTRRLARGPLAVGLQQVGRASYAIYLVHLPVLLGLLALGATPSTLGRAGLFVLTSVAATLAGLWLTARTARMGRPAPR